MTAVPLRTAAARVDPGALADARWSGLHGAAVHDVKVVETFGLDDGSGIALVDALTADGTIRFAIPSDDPILGAAADAGPWCALHALRNADGDRGGRLVRVPEGAGRAAIARRSGTDQSHTNVIIDESTVLKLYRRLPTTGNPEAELLGALAAVPGEVPVPALHGRIEVIASDGATTPLAIEQQFVPGAVDAFETLADGIAEWLCGLTMGPPAMTIPANVGLALARLHAALSGDARPATRGERRVWRLRAEARVEAAIATTAVVDPALSERLTRLAPAILRGLAALDDPKVPAIVQWIHGDLHLGQVLVTGTRAYLVDFEGDPMRTPDERLALATPARDVAGFLRSLDHVARSGLRRANERLHLPDDDTRTARVDGWVALAREAFLQAYGGSLHPSLLRACELEKAMLEFAYAARFLPTWLYAPAGALATILPEAADGH